MVTILSLLGILVMVGIGWKRGAARLGAAFAVLLLAGMLARPLYPLTGWLVVLLGSPKILVPTLATLCSGFLLFAILLIPTMIWVKKKLGDERPSWDGPLGAVMGGVWGLTLVLLTLTGLSSVARLDRAMRQGTAEAGLRADARRGFERQAEAEMRPLRPTMTRQRYEQEKQNFVAEAEQSYRLDPAELREKTPEGPLDSLLVDLKHSPFQSVVDSVSPVNEKTETILRDLTIVVGDSALFSRFREHPVVKELMDDPVVRGLSEDKEIAVAIIEGRYRDLLDHPKMLAAVERDDVRQKFAKVDIAAILEEVRAGGRVDR